MNIVGRKVKDLFGEMMSDVAKKDYGRMDIMHHILAGFKSLFAE
jgi:hypothetical protein